MSTKKTIQINPELFKLPGNRTRKQRERKKIPINPVVTPNNIKNKLLQRIKEHKNNELKMHNNIKSNIARNNTNTNNIETYSNEFYGALDYLSELTKKQKQIESKQRILNTKTLKNYNQPSSLNASNVSLDLPPELQEPLNPHIIKPDSNEVINVNYKISDNVPYGCLKGGVKKTYREWKELSKPEIQENIRPPTPPKKNLGGFLEGATPILKQEQEEPNSSNILSREDRLAQIKNKLKKIEDKETLEKKESLEKFKKLEKELASPTINSLEDLNSINNDSINEEEIVENVIKEHEKNIENDKTKQFLKKTIKRKFTLGKSDKMKRVSILIKNKNTRKRIINAQKDLKKTNITDIRKYLRQHGLLKAGSTCPADILRKIFESSLLTGDVLNTNKETLLHNFISSSNDEK